MKTSIQELKKAIIEFVGYRNDAQRGNTNLYDRMADQLWNEKIGPFVKNEKIETWEQDIQKRFLDNPYVRFAISEKQAYCLARAFAAINPETISQL